MAVEEAEQVVAGQVAAPRTEELVLAELTDVGTRMGTAYASGNIAEATPLQIQAQKLHKELAGMQTKAAQGRVIHEITQSTQPLIEQALRQVISGPEFRSVMEQAVNAGFTSYNIVLTVPTKERLVEDKEAQASIGRQMWTGGAVVRAPRASADGAKGAQGGGRAVAVLVDGQRYDSRAALVEAYGDERQKALPKSYWSGEATRIIKRLEAEGHTVVFVND